METDKIPQKPLHVSCGHRRRKVGPGEGEGVDVRHDNDETRSRRDCRKSLDDPFRM